VTRTVAFVVGLLLAGACEKQQPPVVSNSAGSARSAPADARRRLPPELLKILVDPGDKGPLRYVIDGDGNEWLVNERNGYRYPVRDGVPVMFLEEGAKHRVPQGQSSSAPL
jgi:uncharacterized protein YbaR (Trm112 family)